MRRATLIVLLVCPFFVTACSTMESKNSVGQRMVVSQDRTIFYRHMLLRKGVVVKVLKKEFLYSLVELSNGQKGYVANDALALAPSIQEKPVPTVVLKSPQRAAKAKKTSSKTPLVNNPSEGLPKPSFRY
jgi:uncharacterized protein YgiM (DUF1202 family)